jgi:hypothetical protein
MADSNLPLDIEALNQLATRLRDDYVGARAATSRSRQSAGLATSFAPSISFSRGTPMFSTQAGHRLRGSRTILRVLRREGAKSFGRVGLKKRLPSK